MEDILVTTATAMDTKVMVLSMEHTVMDIMVEGIPIEVEDIIQMAFLVVTRSGSSLLSKLQHRVRQNVLRGNILLSPANIFVVKNIDNKKLCQ